MQKKIYIFFFCCCFFAVFVLRKTQLAGKGTTQGGMPFQVHAIHIGKAIILGCFQELSC
jgi:hypothetical protein